MGLSKERIRFATIFLEAAARALLLERELGHGDPYPDAIAAVVRGTRELAVRNALTDPALLKNAIYIHRIWMMAALQQEVARLTNDPRLSEIASSYAKRAISRQRPDGIMPELDGFNVGYQAASILYAARFLAESDPGPLQDLAKRSLELGAKWLATRVREDASIDPTASTRTGVEHVADGRVKGVFYGVITEAFASAGLILGEDKYRKLATKIEKSAAFKRWAGR